MVSKVKMGNSNSNRDALIEKLNANRPMALALADLAAHEDLKLSEAIAILSSAMKVEADMKALRKEAIDNPTFPLIR